MYSVFILMLLVFLSHLWHKRKKYLYSNPIFIGNTLNSKRTHLCLVIG